MCFIALERANHLRFQGPLRVMLSESEPPQRDTLSRIYYLEAVSLTSSYNRSGWFHLHSLIVHHFRWVKMD